MRYMIDTYGNVDLGTLDWNISGQNFYTYGIQNKVKKPKDDNTIANIYCNLYRAVPLNASFVEGDMAVGASGALYLRDTRYTTTAEFKEAMRGQILRYELETPANGGYLPMYKGRYKVSDVCQLLDKSKYPATQTINGITFTNNGDGTITVNGTAPTVLSAQIELLRFNPIVNHIYLCIGCPSGGGYPRYRLEAAIYDNSDNWKMGFSDAGNGGISSKLEEDRYIAIRVQIYSGYTTNNLVFKPQLFDLTEMFGAGNEPTTVAEFREKFPDELYPYSPYCWARIKSLIYKDDIEYIKMK